MRRAVVAAFAVLLMAAVATAAPTISTKTLTISGISAGGAMTVQYEIAYSTKVRAAGVIAGVPYYCGQDDVYVALNCMSEPYIIDNSLLFDYMQQLEDASMVDELENIKNHAVMLFSGTQDTVVAHGTMVALAQQYQLLGLEQYPSASNRTAGIRAIFDVPAEHSWVTNFYGNACGHLGSPFVNNCGIDFAGEFLKMAFQHMDLKYNTTRGTYQHTRMGTFSQSHFGAGHGISLDTVGYIYVPAGCQPDAPSSTTCHVHINFHGCEQQRSLIGNEYVVHTGLNEWAETNNVIVVYPQTVASQLIPYNPKGCFDWWGYAGNGYATKTGAQMKVVDAIVNYVLEHGTLPAQ